MQVDGDDSDSLPPEPEGFLPGEIADLAAAAAPEPEPVPEEAVTPPEFDERHRLDFQGLLYIGALQHEFSWSGHRFVIRTLTVGELLEVALAQRAFRDSIGDARAYSASMVAACVVSVDGKPLPRPIGSDTTEFLERMRYVRDSWYPWTVDAVYEQYVILESRVDDILRAMGKVRPSTASTDG